MLHGKFLSDYNFSGLKMQRKPSRKLTFNELSSSTKDYLMTSSKVSVQTGIWRWGTTKEVRIIFMLYQVCTPCSDSSGLRCDTFSHYKYPCCLRFLGETQTWGCLKCFSWDCMSGVLEWLLVLGEHMHHCGLSATVICRLSFSFDCIYLNI